ncbi:MAG: pyruvate kinase [Bacteroidales bacterium]
MELALQKRTKIVATISDRCCEVDFLRELYAKGMNVVRINTAHQTPETSMQLIQNVREVSSKIAILLDTKGPEIRTTSLENDAPIDIKVGDKIKVVGNPNQCCNSTALCVNYAGFVADVPMGAMMLIDDGDIQFKVIEKNVDHLVCEAQNSSIIKGRKTVNVPNVSFKLPPLNPKDESFINWAIDNELDFIAHSFVRTKEDVMAVQKILDNRKSPIKIIAKIENREGVENIDEILDYAYGVMVARGDLGVEIEPEELPGIQKMLVEKCKEREKPVIIATQMLHSMIDNPRPTRAEVADVANAIAQQTDAIMLSGETAYGKYPIESVHMMTKIAISAEKNVQYQKVDYKFEKNDVAMVVAKSAVQMSREIAVKAFITDSFSGRTPRYLSAFRSSIPIYTLCYRAPLVRQLALSYGVYCFSATPLKNNDEFSRHATRYLCDRKFIEQSDLVTIMAGNYSVKGSSSFLEIGVAQNLIGDVNQEAYYS